MKHTSFDVQLIQKALQNIYRSLKCLKYWINSDLHRFTLEFNFQQENDRERLTTKLETNKAIQTPYN